MKPEHWSRIKEGFQHALDLSGNERALYLDRLGEEDPSLRRGVEELLAADETNNGEFLAPPEPSVAYRAIGTGEPHPDEGRTLGRYKLVRRIASGGMGQVFLATRTDSYEEKVAVKLIKRGMDTEAILRRFENERQTLADLAHPHIGRLQDGGATDDGRPYLVMEYIDGLPIDEYCDDRGLSIEERLRLFLDVCSAVQYAHGKHVVHRDLKPSNILVTGRAGKPIPKIIDFGISTLVGNDLDGRTTLTHAGQVLGSPSFMSPEQADSSAPAVDERSDVYSLGVILYLLLVGRLPYETVPRSAEDLVRLRDTDAPTPSTRIVLKDDQATDDMARKRRTDPSNLRRVVRGDLDWITRKAVEMDRERRYASTAMLGADIDRYLRDEPALAGPPGARYRLGKFIRRNKIFVVVLAVMFVSILGGLVAGFGWYLGAERVRADRATLVNVVEEVSGEVADAHLWFEEWLAEDTTIDIERDVLEPLASCDTLLRNAASGESTPYGSIGPSVRTQSAGRLAELAHEVGLFANLTIKRQELEAGTGSKLDQDYDSQYNRIQGMCDAMRREAGSADFDDWRRSVVKILLINVVALVFFATLVLLLLRTRPT